MWLLRSWLKAVLWGNRLWRHRERVQIKFPISSTRQELVWAPACLCTLLSSSRVFDVHGYDIDHFQSTCSGSRGSSLQLGRLALQISACGTPLICPPASHHNPSPAILLWQVEVAPGCPWPPLHCGTGQWDWIRPDQGGLFLLESQKKLQVSKRLLSRICIFLTELEMNHSTPCLMSEHSQTPISLIPV